MVGGHDGSDQYPGYSEGPKDSLHLVPPQGVKGLLEFNEDHDCLTDVVCPASLDHTYDGIEERSHSDWPLMQVVLVQILIVVSPSAACTVVVLNLLAALAYTNTHYNLHSVVCCWLRFCHQLVQILHVFTTCTMSHYYLCIVAIDWSTIVSWLCNRQTFFNSDWVQGLIMNVSSRCNAKFIS